MPRFAIFASFIAMLAVGFAAGADSQDKAPPTTLPDLRMELPDERYGDHHTPVFMDAVEEPGKVLYRFDAIIRNHGGILDVYRRAEDGHVMQAVHEGGLPAVAPDPSKPTEPGPRVTITDRTAANSSFVYTREPTHEHWHYLTASAYEIAGQGISRKSGKVGFCLHDTYWTEKYFKPDFRTTGPLTWCGPDQPDSQFTHMGISPDAGDLYDAQDHFQWLDVTGLAPGRYSLKATANPFGMLQEATRANNTTTVERVLPGTIAAPVISDGSGALKLPLSGEIVAAAIPARSSKDCQPPEKGTECYRRTTATGPLSFTVAKAPANGTVTIGAARGLGAVASYVPAAGFTGKDSFTYTVTDGRGLVSSPATVSVRVGPAGPVASSRVIRRGKRYVLALDARQPGTLTGRLSPGGKVKATPVRRGRNLIVLPAAVSRKPGLARLKYTVRTRKGSQRGTLSFRIA